MNSYQEQPPAAGFDTVQINVDFIVPNYTTSTYSNSQSLLFILKNIESQISNLQIILTKNNLS